MYSKDRVDEGLRVLHGKVEEEMNAWVPRCWDVVRSLCHSPEQADAACRLLGMVLENIRRDALGIILQGLPDEVEYKKPEQEQGFYEAQ